MDDIVFQNDSHRIGFSYCEFADELEPEAYAPLVKIERFKITDRTSEYTEDSDQRVGEALATAISHWRVTPADTGWQLVERYMRAFWGVEELHAFHDGAFHGSWYVSVDEDLLQTYKDWVYGEVFIVTVERKVSEETVTRELDGTELSRTKREAWEYVDSTDVTGWQNIDLVVEEFKERIKN